MINCFIFVGKIDFLNISLIKILLNSLFYEKLSHYILSLQTICITYKNNLNFVCLLLNHKDEFLEFKNTSNNK